MKIEIFNNVMKETALFITPQLDKSDHEKFVEIIKSVLTEIKSKSVLKQQ